MVSEFIEQMLRRWERYWAQSRPHDPTTRWDRVDLDSLAWEQHKYRNWVRLDTNVVEFIRNMERVAKAAENVNRGILEACQKYREQQG